MSEPSREHLRAIIQTQTEIAASELDLDSIMQLIASRGQELTSLCRSHRARRRRRDGLPSDHRRGDPVPRGAAEEGGQPLRPLRKRGEGFTQRRHRVRPTGRAEACKRVNARSMLCVPLVHRGEAVGVLKVYSPKPRNFDDGDVETLELLSGAIAAHMSHANLFAAEVHDGRHDALTGLLNRRAYEERLPVEVARASRYGWPLTLCLLDLDGFKAVNDTLGHPAGDTLLQRVAALIDESRLTDDGFRIGGDEFAILMPKTYREDAALAATRLCRSIGEIEIAGGEIGASFGLAEGLEDPAALHATADSELLAAKDDLYGRPGVGPPTA